MWLELLDVIIWIIVTQYLKMWYSLNLRQTCKKMRNATCHPFLKSLWNIKKKQLEEQSIENRSKKTQRMDGWMSYIHGKCYSILTTKAQIIDFDSKTN